MRISHSLSVIRVPKHHHTERGMTIIAALLLLLVLCALSIAAMSLRVTSSEDAHRHDQAQEDYWSARSAAETAVASIRSDLPTIYMAELAIAKQAAGSVQLKAFDDPTVSTSMPLYSERDWQFAWNNETQRFAGLEGTRTSVAPAQATSLLGQPSLWLARHAAIPATYGAQKGITASLSITLSEAYRLQPQNGGEPLYLARYTVSSKVNEERDELQGLIALSASASNGGTLVPAVCNNLAISAPGNVGPIPSGIPANLPITFKNATNLRVFKSDGTLVYQSPVIQSSNYQTINVTTPALNANATFIASADNGGCLSSATIYVTVAGAICPNLTVSPTSQSFPASGGSSTASITAGANCTAAATTTDSWITITAGASGTGARTLSYNVAANSGGVRIGRITVSGQGGPIDITITQTAAACNYTMNPASANYPATGGSGQIGITTAGYCNWTAATGYSWLHLTSGSAASGSGQVSYLVDANTGPARTGTIQVAGYNFLVTQDGVCSSAPTISSFSVTPTSAAPGSSLTLSWIVAGGGSFSINQGVGDVTGQNSITITAPGDPTAYTLTATNACGTSTASATFTPAAQAQPCPLTQQYPELSGSTKTFILGTYKKNNLNYQVGPPPSGVAPACTDFFTRYEKSPEQMAIIAYHAPTNQMSLLIDTVAKPNAFARVFSGNAHAMVDGREASMNFNADLTADASGNFINAQAAVSIYIHSPGWTCGLPPGTIGACNPDPGAVTINLPVSLTLSYWTPNPGDLTGYLVGTASLPSGFEIQQFYPYYGAFGAEKVYRIDNPSYNSGPYCYASALTKWTSYDICP